MTMLKRLESTLKKKYNIVVGQKTLEEVKLDIEHALNAKIKISGRSYKTGEKKVIFVPAKILLNM